LTAQKCNEREVLEPLAVLLAPFAAHLSEELWELMGHDTSISKVSFPIHEPLYLVESSKNYPVSFNGKMRFTIELSLKLNPQEIEKIIMKDERTQQQLQGRNPKKVIVVPGKIINIVG
jgi:leucyl-tRNA synthetase